MCGGMRAVVGLRLAACSAGRKALANSSEYRRTANGSDVATVTSTEHSSSGYASCFSSESQGQVGIVSPPL